MRSSYAIVHLRCSLAFVVRQNSRFRAKLSGDTPAIAARPHINRGAQGEASQRALLKRLETGPEFGSPARFWTRSHKEVSIAAKLTLMDASIGSRSSSLPACSAIVANDRACSLRTSCSLLSKGLGARF